MTEITDLPSLAVAADADELVIYDLDGSGDKSKKITKANLLSGVAMDGEAHDFTSLEATVSFTAPAATINSITAAASLAVGSGGSTLTLVLGGSLAFTFTSIASGASQTQTATLTGAATSDMLGWALTAHLADGLCADAVISASDTVSLKIHNTTGGSITPGAITMRALLHRVT